MKEISLVILLALTSAANAATDDDIMTCAGIPDSKERLLCFDATARMVLSRRISSPENYILQRFKKSADK
jgi:hypothetical protein